MPSIPDRRIDYPALVLEVLIIRTPGSRTSIWSRDKTQISIFRAMKCGTSAIATFLNQHSKLYDMGETYFFNRFHDKGYGFYDQFLKNKNGYKENLIPFEKTPTYYTNLNIPERILKMNNRTKIIFIVCDNVRRTISRWSILNHYNIDKHRL